MCKDPADVYQKQIQQQYTIYCDMRYGRPQLDEITLDHILSKMFIYTARKCKLGWYNTRGPLLCGGVITAVWTVLVNSCNLEL